jgi:hypothetical protein
MLLPAFCLTIFFTNGTALRPLITHMHRALPLTGSNFYTEKPPVWRRQAKQGGAEGEDQALAAVSVAGESRRRAQRPEERARSRGGGAGMS